MFYYIKYKKSRVSHTKVPLMLAELNNLETLLTIKVLFLNMSRLHIFKIDKYQSCYNLEMKKKEILDKISETIVLTSNRKKIVEKISVTAWETELVTK